MSELTDAAPYIAIILILVAASAFFSGTEVAMFSLRRVDREQLARSKRSSDKLILRFVSSPRRLIATLLIGNESVNISVSVVMAVLVGIVFDGSQIQLAVLATALALPLLLFFGEITPKTVAIKTSIGWARKAAWPLWVFWIVVTPIRWIVRTVAEAIVRPLGGSTDKGIPRDLSENEFKALVDAGNAEGEVDARERRLIHKVFEFGDKTVADAMCPRDKVFALSYELPVSRLIREVAARGYSRVPIYQGSRDNIRGLLFAKDLVVQGTGLTAPRRLVELLHEPLFVAQTTPLERLFRIFKQRKTHLALVVNEYGKLAGLITMEDLLEELFGEIRDEREHQKTVAAAVAKQRLASEPVSADFGRVSEQEAAGGRGTAAKERP